MIRIASFRKAANFGPLATDIVDKNASTNQLTQFIDQLPPFVLSYSSRSIARDLDPRRLIHLEIVLIHFVNSYENK